MTAAKDLHVERGTSRTQGLWGVVVTTYGSRFCKSTLEASYSSWGSLDTAMEYGVAFQHFSCVFPLQLPRRLSVKASSLTNHA